MVFAVTPLLLGDDRKRLQDHDLRRTVAEPRNRFTSRHNANFFDSRHRKLR